jgi:hypothetical protein
VRGAPAACKRPARVIFFQFFCRPTTRYARRRRMVPRGFFPDFSLSQFKPGGDLFRRGKSSAIKYDKLIKNIILARIPLSAREKCG